MFIQKLGLKNFKCFKEVDVDFSKITLLTGENSSGKSSLIYGILAPLQSVHRNGDSFPLHLSLNGNHINMGGFEEISFDHDPKNIVGIDLTLAHHKTILGRHKTIIFDLKTSWYLETQTKSPQLDGLKIKETDLEIIIKKNKNSSYTFSANFSHPNNPPIENITIKEVNYLNDRIIRYSIPLQDGLNYEIDYSISESSFNFFYNILQLESSFNFISSFRLQPERTYYQSLTSNKVDKFGNAYIDQILKWSDTQSEELTRLISILKDLGMVYDIKPHRLSGGRFEIKVKVKKQSKWESLADVGFGTSQFMPIIVADLQLSDESTLIMCQPEIHLHPSIQANLGDYLVKQVNEKKKQYIVETHSEYLLNRIRLLIVKGEIEPEDVAVYYFENSVKEGSVTHRIEFTKDGQILNAPRGFFETYMIDTMDIALNA